jgi:hypothetical protein
MTTPPGRSSNSEKEKIFSFPPFFFFSNVLSWYMLYDLPHLETDLRVESPQVCVEKSPSWFARKLIKNSTIINRDVGVVRD